MKHFIIKIFNAYWLKEYILLLRYLRYSSEPLKNQMLISIIDDKRNCQGLTDRLKGIVSIFALSKALNIPFKCIFTHPFYLTEFLVPNKYNWVPTEEELSNSVKDVRFRIMRKQNTIKRLIRILPSKKQIRIYANMDYLEEINSKYNQQFEWGSLFNELFQPTEILKLQLNENLEKIKEKDFVACTFRFQSLLGDFKEYHNKSLSNDEQEILIQKNIIGLENLLKKDHCPILVTSDSSTFISRIKNIPNIYTMPGKVVHMDCVCDEQNEVYLKSFIDFFMLSKAKKIYTIGTNKMYPTNFPVYAAKVNNIPFERIIIK